MEAYGDLLEGLSTDEPEAKVCPEDHLVIFYTSGTTGTPRGAVYSHGAKLENTLVKALDIGLASGDRHLVVLPMFHIGGDSHIWPFFLTGGCNVISPKPTFDPKEMMQTINDERITDVHIVPTQLVALLNLPEMERHSLPSLKRVWYAASPMPVEVLKRGISAFGPIFLQGYGQTESGPHTTVLGKADHLRASESEDGVKALASCGKPCIGVHMRIVDLEGQDVPAETVGEIIVRSRRIMSEYWRRPEETAVAIEDGWLHTGDLGYYDEEGYVYIVDRKKDMIITGGENVFPKEVEEVLYRHPAVLEAAVIGVPDAYWVERVHAVIALRKDVQVTEQEIINFCREHIAKYKAPKSVEFVDDLPKNPQGKILKKVLRAKYQKD
jgi:acyl-CoA synthetase (AMP-forming)/AMP-acid ligase II